MSIQSITVYRYDCLGSEFCLVLSDGADDFLLFSIFTILDFSITIRNLLFGVMICGICAYFLGDLMWLFCNLMWIFNLSMFISWYISLVSYFNTYVKKKDLDIALSHEKENIPVRKNISQFRSWICLHALFWKTSR